MAGTPRGPVMGRARGWDALTAAELRVVRLVMEGLTNPQIASRLFVSAQTVKTHMKNVFRKLGVSSRAELAAVAARREVMERPAAAPFR
ncbi:MAG: helix-turn-helix transcriptional regulator [Actinomycetota bacterium]|nr:helix-turn-helix transcriptional regulator [Actinomycetota bacterium]